MLNIATGVANLATPPIRLSLRELETMAKASGLPQVSLYEFEVFSEISKTHSIRETARRFHSEPGQISRLMKRLESKIGARLIERTPTGVTLTQHGTTALKTAQAVLREASELSTLGREAEKSRIFGIGSTSFLCARLLGPIVGEQSIRDPNLRLRLIDVAPDQMISFALKGAFDLAVHIGALDWPRSWQSIELGEIKWQLFARAGAKVPKRCSFETIKHMPFVVPVYWTNEGLLEGNDQCPVKLRDRIQGIATATAETALAVLKSSDQLAFLPEILARDSLLKEEIQIVQVKEWKSVAKSVYLTVRSDAVPNKLYEKMSELVRGNL
jgi:DNA-binding transcriptional LysR family regulator